MHRGCTSIGIAVWLLISTLFAAASTHYIAASGLDSNNGTSKTTAWLHAPGMPNCSSNCASYAPAAGDSIIFRGGDTWHLGNSAASPYTGGTWIWTWSGSSSNFIYIGVDQTWFSGSSWTRPILTADNPTSTNPVSSCAHKVGANNVLVNLNFVRYITFDNFEVTGMCWDSTSQSNNLVGFAGAVAGYQNPMNIQNNYLHGWTYTTAGTQAGGGGFSGYNQNFGVTLQYNVVDGSDSDPHSLEAFYSDGYIVQYNIVRYVGGTSIMNTCHIVHDNVFEQVRNVTDGSTHTDVFMCYGEAGVSNFPGDGTPNLFYNNVFRNIPGAVSYVLAEFPPPGRTDYVFNNVWHDYAGAPGNFNPICEDGTCGSVISFNNTGVAIVPSYTGCIQCNLTDPRVTSVNNHWVTNAGTTPSAVFQNTSSPFTENHSVYQTSASASAQGYNTANDFAPTSSGDATVGVGSNQTSGYCSQLQNSAAQAACVLGTTAGCGYNSQTHSVSCPAATPNARPSSGAWDVGAYQFSGGTQPAPPTGLAATPY